MVSEYFDCLVEISLCVAFEEIACGEAVVAGWEECLDCVVGFEECCNGFFFGCEFSREFVRVLVCFRVSDDASRVCAVPHDLGATGACDTALVRVEFAVFEDIVGHVRICEGASAETDKRCFVVDDGGCGRMGCELPEPGISGCDNREYGVCLLDLCYDVQETCDACDRVFWRRRRSDDRRIERASIERLVVGICDGDVDEWHAHFAERCDMLQGFSKVHVHGAVLRHAEAVGIGHFVRGVHARCDEDVFAGILDFR